MTEVVPVELELPIPVEKGAARQQLTIQEDVPVKLPWKRPDLRVALVTKFWPRGGGEEYFFNLARSVSNLCPTVVVANQAPAADRPETTSRLQLVQAWKLDSLTYPFRIAKACIRQQPKVVHVNHEYMMYGRPFYGALMPLILLLLRLARRPTLVTLHSVVPHESVWNGFFKRYGSKRLAPLKIIFFIAWTRITLRLANHVVVHSHASKDILTNEYGYPSKNISVMGHGIEKPILTSRAASKQILGLEGRKIVLNVGYLHEKKGIEFLIRAMGSVAKTHPEAVLVVAGGPHISQTNPEEFHGYVEKLTSIVDEVHAENNVVLRAEYIPDHLLTIYLSAADMIVLPYVEQFGTSGVLARAMAAGTAVVATRVNPFFEIIEDGVNGMLVNPGDSGQLSEAICRFLDNETMRDTLGNNLRASARDLAWPDVAKMHVELYSQMAAKTRGV